VVTRIRTGVTGFSITNALLQHALPDIEPLCIDIEHLQYKGDRLVSALREIGYDVHAPEGTFYLLSRAEKAELVQRLVREIVNAWPGIEKTADVLGGEACIV
jgi:hypothetical protein